MSPLPPDALRRILRDCTASISVDEAPDVPVIPVWPDAWATSLRDADLEARCRSLRQLVAELGDAAQTASAKTVRSLGERIANLTADIKEDLACLTSMTAGGAQAASVNAAVIGLVRTGLQRVRSGNALPLDEDLQFLDEALAGLRTTQPAADDACIEAFGVRHADLQDARGVFSPALLLRAYYGRYWHLALRLNHLLSAVTASPPDLLNALHPAEALVMTPRPLITLRTARHVRDLIEASLQSDANAAAAPLRDLKARVDRSATNHAGIVRVRDQLDQADGESDRAVLSLDLYRRMVEGQLRPWAWTLLRLRGRAGKPPEVASLREQLLADGHPVLHEAARAILPAARNAAAHEDYEWDEETTSLVVGSDTVTVEELADATERAYAFMAGAECAFACARATSGELARELDAGVPDAGLRAINESMAVKHFGTNGLGVRRSKHERGVFSVVLDEVPFVLINPCLQAVMWASRHLSRTKHFRVLLEGSDRPVVDVTREALDTNFVVWRHAAATFAEMPTSVFLPLNAAARMSVELPDVAARAVSWLALNDAVHTYIDAYESSAPRSRMLQTFSARLDLLATATAATISMFPREAVDPLEEVLALVGPAGTWAATAARGFDSGPSARLERAIRKLYDSLPSVSVLPTLDPRTLSQVEADSDDL